MPKAYRAHALTQLVNEVNAEFPNRQKGKGSSDGWKGDADHQARKSDHNPDPKTGVVRAQDIDEDLLGADNPLGQEQMVIVAEELRRLGEAGDPRLVGRKSGINGYVIYEGHIAGAGKGWKWRKYTGPNAHKHHLHLSVCGDPDGYDSTKPWGVHDWFNGRIAPQPISLEEEPEMKILIPVDEQGRAINPATGNPYAPQMVIDAGRHSWLTSMDEQKQLLDTGAAGPFYAKPFAIDIHKRLHPIEERR